MREHLNTEQNLAAATQAATDAEAAFAAAQAELAKAEKRLDFASRDLQSRLAARSVGNTKDPKILGALEAEIAELTAAIPELRASVIRGEEALGSAVAALDAAKARQAIKAEILAEQAAEQDAKIEAMVDKRARKAA